MVHNDFKMPTTIIIISYNCPRNDKTARAGRISVKQMILHNSGQWSRHTIGTSLGFSRLDGKGRGLSDWSSCSLELSRFAQHRLFITGIFKQIEFEDLNFLFNLCWQMRGRNATDSVDSSCSLQTNGLSYQIGWFFYRLN